MKISLLNGMDGIFFKISLIALVANILLKPSSNAAVIVDYQFVGGSAASSDTEANSTAGNFTISTLLAGNGGFSAATETAFGRSNLTPVSSALAVSQGSYFSFTVTPDSGYQLDLSSLTFYTSYDPSVGFDTNYFVRSSLDSYASTIAGSSFVQAGTADVSLTQRTVSLSSLAYQDIEVPVTFRIYLWDTSNSSARFVRVGDVSLLGDVTAVPEPSTWAMILAGGIVLAVLRKRNSKSTTK